MIQAGYGVIEHATLREYAAVAEEFLLADEVMNGMPLGEDGYAVRGCRGLPQSNAHHRNAQRDDCGLLALDAPAPSLASIKAFTGFTRHLPTAAEALRHTPWRW